ncbi:hypothetical protein Q8A73_013583 [Channa argus]|nr:hypothetical protein Q8A73_013583 [Channa argus]
MAVSSRRLLFFIIALICKRNANAPADWPQGPAGEDFMRCAEAGGRDVAKSTSMDNNGPAPRPPTFPICRYRPGLRVACGKRWPPSMCPHHHRGQSPSNKSGSLSKGLQWHLRGNLMAVIPESLPH